MNKIHNTYNVFLSLVFILLAYSTLLIPSTALAYTDVVTERREVAVLLSRQGDTEQALALLKALHTEYPTDLLVLFDYTAITSWAGKHEEAARLSKNFTNLNPPEYALMAAAFSHRHLQNYKEAQALYAKGRELYPDNKQFLAGMALLLTEEGKLFQAEAALAGNDKAPELRDAREYLNEQQSLYWGKTPEELLHAKQQDQEIMPALDAAVAKSWAGKPTQALQDLQRLHAAYPTNQRILWDYVTLLSWNKQYKKAVSLQKNINSANVPEYVVEALGMALTRAYKHDEAIEFYREAVARFPHNFELTKGLAFALANQKRTTEAIKVLNASRDAAPISQEALDAIKVRTVGASRSLALGKAKEGDYEGALSLLTKATIKFPENTDIIKDYATVIDWEKERNAITKSVATARQDPVSALAQKQLIETRIAKLQQNKVAYLETREAETPLGRPYKNVPTRADAPYRKGQDKAIELAKNGDLTGALQILTKLHAEYPNDPYVLADHILLSNWEHDDATVALLSKRLNPKTAPSYIITPVGYSFSNLGQPYYAQKLGKEMIQARPYDAQIRIRYALLLGDYGRFFQALSYLPAETSELKEVLEKARKRLKYKESLSLQDLNRAHARLAANPNDSNARQLKASALQGVEAPYLAWVELNHPQAKASKEVLQNATIRKHEKETLWGEAIPITHDTSARVELLQSALIGYNSLITDPSCQTECRDKARVGRIKTYYLFNKLEETVAEYEELNKAGVYMPAGALLSVGGAYLELKQPQKAEAAYKRALEEKAKATQEDLFTIQGSLVWAYLEQEKLRAALQQAHDNIDNTPERNPKAIFDRFEREKESAKITLPLIYTYTGFLSKGADLIEEGLQKAPSNPDLLINQGINYTLRGLPLTALESFQLADINETSGHLEIGRLRHVFTALMLSRQWRKAHDAYKSIATYLPYVKEVEAVKREWETHNLFELNVESYGETSHGTKKGSHSSAASNGMGIETLLFSPPIDYNWRVYALTRYAWGRFAEGKAFQKKLGGGVEYRSRNLDARLEANANDVSENSTQFGARLMGTVYIDDHWSIPFSLEKDSNATPLRALFNDITANSGSLGLTHFWSESRVWRIVTNYMDFSDGNQRFNLNTELTQRLYTWYTHTIDGTVYGVFEHNSKNDDRPYFNPKSLFEAGVLVEYKNILWRHYTQSLSHSLSAGIGGVHQERFGSKPTWRLGYSQELNLSDRFSTHYGYSLQERPYDGNREWDNLFFLNFVWKF